MIIIIITYWEANIIKCVGWSYINSLINKKIKGDTGNWKQKQSGPNIQFITNNNKNKRVLGL